MPATAAKLNDIQAIESGARPTTPNTLKVDSLPPDQFANEQNRAEAAYLKQVNDLEKLKIEKQIEELNQAIATAKLATATAEKARPNF